MYQRVYSDSGRSHTEYMNRRNSKGKRKIGCTGGEAIAKVESDARRFLCLHWVFVGSKLAQAA